MVRSREEGVVWFAVTVVMVLSVESEEARHAANPNGGSVDDVERRRPAEAQDAGRCEGPWAHRATDRLRVIGAGGYGNAFV